MECGRLMLSVNLSHSVLLLWPGYAEKEYFFISAQQLPKLGTLRCLTNQKKSMASGKGRK